MIWAKSDSTSQKTILCVDDDADTCEVLGYILSEYDFVYAHNLKDSSPLVHSRQFDLYLLDNWLPDGSGIQLCESIRKLHPETPIIFTSAIGLNEELQRAFDAGATRYLVKPIEPDKLINTVKELIGD
jgi:DNA-binding response OmpR family regulator